MNVLRNDFIPHKGRPCSFQIKKKNHGTISFLIKNALVFCRTAAFKSNSSFQSQSQQIGIGCLAIQYKNERDKQFDSLNKLFVQSFIQYLVIGEKKRLNGEKKRLNANELRFDTNLRHQSSTQRKKRLVSTNLRHQSSKLIIFVSPRKFFFKRHNKSQKRHNLRKNIANFFQMIYTSSIRKFFRTTVGRQSESFSERRSDTSFASTVLEFSSIISTLYFFSRTKHSRHTYRFKDNST